MKSVTGQDQYQWLSPSSPSICPSESPPEQQSDHARAQLSPPACTASLEPLPSSPFPSRASTQKASRSNSRVLYQQPARHHPQPQVSGQAFSPLSIIPVVSRLPCSLSPEQLHEIAYTGGSNVEQAACCLHGTARHSTASQLCHSTQAQLKKLLVRSRFCHCCSMGSTNQDAGCRKVRCH